MNANALHVTEVVIFVFGTIWLLSILLNIYEARHLFVHPALSNLLRLQSAIPLSGRGHTGGACTSIVTLFGFIGAFIVAIMSFAAHISQATGTPGRSITYIDSVGPGTWANFTRDARGYVNSTRY
jgi:hypothetical protein